MSFEQLLQNPIPLREAADFFIRLKYAEAVPPPAPVQEQAPSPEMDQSVEVQSPEMPAELAALADLARLKLQAALAYRVYSESLLDLTNTSLGAHFKEHCHDELGHVDYLVRRLSVMHGPIDFSAPLDAPIGATDVGEILSILMDIERGLLAKLQEVHALVGENPMKYELEAMMVLDQHHFDDLMQHQPAAQEQVSEEIAPPKTAESGIPLPPTAMGQQKPVDPPPPLTGTAAGQQMKMAFLKAAAGMGIVRDKRYTEELDTHGKLLGNGGEISARLTSAFYGERSNAPVPPTVILGSGMLQKGLPKTAGQTLDPETTAYLQQEQDAGQAVSEAEEGYYRQRFAAAMQELEATQGQLEQQQLQIQTLEEQAAQHQQQSDEVLMQAQQTQQMASDTATQAHGVASQAIQQNQLQSQELIQQMQLSANMRSAIDQMKQQLMQVAMQPSPPSTTMQQAFDLTAAPGAPVTPGMEGQMQDPSMMGPQEQGVDPNAPQAAGAPAQGQPPATPAAPAKPPPAPKPPAPAAGSVAAPPGQLKQAADTAQLVGALAGAAIGGGATYRESKSDPQVMQKKIRDLEQQHAETGSFGTSMALARARIQEALTDVARRNPVSSTIAGTALGARQGAAAGPAVVRLAQNLRNFNRGPAPL